MPSRALARASRLQPSAVALQPAPGGAAPRPGCDKKTIPPAAQNRSGAHRSSGPAAAGAGASPTRRHDRVHGCFLVRHAKLLRGRAAPSSPAPSRRAKHGPTTGAERGCLIDCMSKATTWHEPGDLILCKTVRWSEHRAAIGRVGTAAGCTASRDRQRQGWRASGAGHLAGRSSLHHASIRARPQP